MPENGASSLKKRNASSLSWCCYVLLLFIVVLFKLVAVDKPLAMLSDDKLICHVGVLFEKGIAQIG